MITRVMTPAPAGEAVRDDIAARTPFRAARRQPRPPAQETAPAFPPCDAGVDTCSTPAKGKPRGKRRPDMTFSLAVAHPEPAAASYPSMDAALRAAKPFILHLYHRWMRDWLDRVLCAQGRGLDPGQIAAALGLTADEVDFYLNPRVVRALREVW